MGELPLEVRWALILGTGQQYPPRHSSTHGSQHGCASASPGDGTPASLLHLQILELLLDQQTSSYGLLVLVPALKPRGTAAITATERQAAFSPSQQHLLMAAGHGGSRHIVNWQGSLMPGTSGQNGLGQNLGTLMFHPVLSLYVHP